MYVFLQNSTCWQLDDNGNRPIQCSVGWGIGVFASRDLDMNRKLGISWNVTPVVGDVPILPEGRTDSYVQLDPSEPLQYLGGPAHLINAGCDTHANCSYRFTSKQSDRSVWTTDMIEEGQEVTALYGTSHRCDLFCVCGESLLPRGRIDPHAHSIQHATTLPHFRRTRFNQLSTSHHVEALTRELEHVQQANRVLKSRIAVRNKKKLSSRIKEPQVLLLRPPSLFFKQKKLNKKKTNTHTCAPRYKQTNKQTNSTAQV